ncbi:hypothetical protein AB0E88_06465 [Streptomyces sp. NPDC028635]|uniref:hypothetical protein n=1 Tax=Streptomyces sp. NPDC028635 TaxID=3154800 RepID=UPI0033D411FC
MNTVRTRIRPVLPRLVGVAVTGAVLALGAEQFRAWIDRRSSRGCGDVESVCITWWGLAFVPLTVLAAVAVLATAYKALDIGPRLVIVPPTVLLAPMPLGAAQTLAGPGAVVLAGGLWCSVLALAAWNRHRVLALSGAAALLLVSLVQLYG